jgi:hypothetical protein
MTTLKKIYILILNWNNWKDTIECLESVFQTRYPNFQEERIGRTNWARYERIEMSLALFVGRRGGNFLYKVILKL